jgi:hypothetical protein
MTSTEALLEQALLDVTPPVGNVLKFFRFTHLPPPLRAMSEKFAELALAVVGASSNPETTVALRKLLESKDAAVRSLV